MECKESCTCDFDDGHFLCDNVNGECSCKEGWKGTGCDEDVDECKEDSERCTYMANSHCKNSLGSYECECNLGYKKNHDKCEGM